jgi:hypothetical protein
MSPCSPNKQGVYSHGDIFFYKMLSNSRIFIGTCNTTLYVKKLTWEFTTIVLRDRGRWEIKNDFNLSFYS